MSTHTAKVMFEQTMVDIDYDTREFVDTYEVFYIDDLSGGRRVVGKVSLDKILYILYKKN